MNDVGKRDRVIVVGGGGGIGGECCRRLASEGSRIVVADHNLAAAREVQVSLPGDGHEAVELDVTSDAGVDTAFDTIAASGPARVLIVASGGPLAATQRDPHVATMAMANWETTIAVNLTGVARCLRKFAQQRLELPLEHGRIVLIGSGAGQIVRGPSDAAYSAAKAGLIGFARQAAFDLAGEGITVNVVAPGPVGTPGFFRTAPVEVQNALKATTLLGRLAHPDEIAAAVAFLTRPEAAYITGATLDVNGGLHMH